MLAGSAVVVVPMLEVDDDVGFGWRASFWVGGGGVRWMAVKIQSCLCSLVLWWAAGPPGWSNSG